MGLHPQGLKSRQVHIILADIAEKDVATDLASSFAVCQDVKQLE